MMSRLTGLPRISADRLKISYTRQHNLFERGEIGVRRRDHEGDRK